MKSKMTAIISIVLFLCLAAGAIVFSNYHGRTSTQIEAITTDNADKTAQIEALTADNADKTARIETLMADNADKMSRIETLTSGNADKAAQIKTLTADNADKTAQIETLTASAESQEKEDLSSVTEGRYASTKRFIQQLKANHFRYPVATASDGTEDDKVEFGIDSNSENGKSFSYACNVFFTEDNTTASFYIWYLVDLDKTKVSAAYEVCNKLNGEWKWPCFFVDDSDNTITACYSMRLANSADDGQILWDTICSIDDVLTSAYDELAVTQKNGISFLKSVRRFGVCSSQRA